MTLEEGVCAGGAGSAVMEVMAAQGITTPVLSLGIPDSFVTQGTVGELLNLLHLDPEGIAAAVIDRLEHLQQTNADTQTS